MDKSILIKELADLIDSYEIEPADSHFAEDVEHYIARSRCLLEKLNEQIDCLAHVYKKYQASLTGWRYKDFPEFVPKIIEYVRKINEAYAKLDVTGRRRVYEDVLEKYYRRTNHIVWRHSKEEFVYRILESRGAHKYLEREGPLFENQDSLLERDKLEDDENNFNLIEALELLFKIISSYPK